MNKQPYSFVTVLTAASLFMVSSVSSETSVACAAVTKTPVVKRTAQSPFQESKIFKGSVSAEVANGEKLLLNGQYPQAATVFHDVLNQNSKDLPALCGMGFALALQFKLDGAEEQFNKALAVNSNEPLAHVGLAFTKVNRLQSSSMTVIQQRQATLTSAEAECKTALNLDPNLPEALTVLGLVQKEEGRFDEAKGNFSKAINEDPKYGMAFVNRGMIEMQQGDTASAITDFQKAIQLRSSNSTAHYALGKAYAQQGSLDKAYKELNIALSLNQNSAPAHIAMGDVYRQQGNQVAAIKEYQRAISIKAESGDAYQKLADLYESRGDLEFGLAQLRSGLALNPNSVDLHRRAGDISLRLEKTDDAMKEYTTVLNTKPDDVAAVEGLTQALVLKAQKESSGAFFASNNYEGADALIQRAIQLNPNNLELQLAEAKLQAISGKPVDLATFGPPTTDPQRVAYAEAALAQFKFTEASQAMATVLQNCKTAKQCFALGDIAFLTRDLDSAEKAYNRAATFGGAETAGRSSRGLASIASARSNANQQLTLANDLARKGQRASAVDAYRRAAYLNIRLADAHLGLAETLQKVDKQDAPGLREAALHYNAYLSLSTNLPEKEREKIARKSEKCTETAYKIEQGHPPSKLSTLFAPVTAVGEKVGRSVKDVF
jgi:tetratricopeptide (TPR) repeat protein